jgi:hypothetical protein
MTTPARPGQWEFLQTRAVKWKWRQVGDAGVVLCESPEFALLAHCMRDAERNGFTSEDHVLSCDEGSVLWSEAPKHQV